MGLKPEIDQYLKQRAAMGLPAVWQASLEEIRGNTHLHVALEQPLIDLFEVRNQKIPGLSSQLPIRIYRPSRDRKSTRLNSSHVSESRMPSSA